MLLIWHQHVNTINSIAMITKFIHLCFSSNTEVMFRVHEDYIRGINDLVIASLKTETTILSYAFMSNHVHCCIQTQCDPLALYRIFKTSYGRYFSAKYGRNGSICQEVRIVNIDGYQHCLTAISYCLRNPLHHGVTNSCVNYAYSSAKAYFRESMGWGTFPQTLKSCPRPCVSSHFSNIFKIRFESDGRASLDTSVDYRQVEMLFKTPSEFAYCLLIRKSGKKWRDDQSDDCTGEPVTLEMLESDYYIVHEMEKNERFSYQVTGLSDLTICQMIDTELVPKYDVKSVYSLSIDEQLSIGHYLKSKYSCSLSQISRCLAIRDDVFFRLFQH